MTELERLLHRERRRLVALLARRLGLSHMALAEDAVQTACLRALQNWPQQGWPAAPEAWLFRVAERAAIDLLRAQQREQPLPDGDDSTEPSHPAHAAASAAPEQRFAGELDDDELALLFAACHPILPPASQVLLALRALAGWELAQLAPLFFSSEAALAQRLARARAQLATVPLEVPAGTELPPRREAVLTALSLMFHEGQRAAGRLGTGVPSGRATDAVRPCWEAIRLARALAAHPAAGAPAADALAAMLLLHGARLTGRFDADGDLLPLPGQPRDRWDGGLIRLGLLHLQRSQRGQQLSRWHLLAGIAAEHAMAPSYAATDWAAIVGYYETLLRLDPSAAPRLGHAIALAEAGSAERAQALLTEWLPQVPQALRAHALAALARASQRLGDTDTARKWLDAAIAVAPHEADARMLARWL
ncbi:sigma-70 family RNA polymerase sigma factor [Inhella sp.]|uniref:sigma-70 family RNA polymerase sigma factor n=1 Tax=Inhella sp. TaxID=1921806 RepID=UPI0035B08DEF